MWVGWDEHETTSKKVCLCRGLKLLEPVFAPEFSPWKGDELTATLLQLATAPRGLLPGVAWTFGGKGGLESCGSAGF